MLAVPQIFGGPMLTHEWEHGELHDPPEVCCFCGAIDGEHVHEPGCPADIADSEYAEFLDDVNKALREEREMPKPFLLPWDANPRYEMTDPADSYRCILCNELVRDGEIKDVEITLEICGNPTCLETRVRNLIRLERFLMEFAASLPSNLEKNLAALRLAAQLRKVPA